MIKKHPWVVAALQYIAWNLSNYLWGSDSKVYYSIYYLNERLFAVLCFHTFFIYAAPRFKWVTKTLIWAAIFKMVYMILVVLKVIEPQQLVSEMGLIFIILTSIITLRWQKVFSRKF